jgi:hypothetical protein
MATPKKPNAAAGLFTLAVLCACGAAAAYSGEWTSAKLIMASSIAILAALPPPREGRSRADILVTSGSFGWIMVDLVQTAVMVFAFNPSAFWIVPKFLISFRASSMVFGPARHKEIVGRLQAGEKVQQVMTVEERTRQSVAGLGSWALADMLIIAYRNLSPV